MSPKVTRITVWIISGLVAALFLLSAIPKFFMPGWLGRFAAWGYSEWFLYLIAVLETLGAIGLLIPQLARYAAAGLIGIMLGAIYTHLSHGEGIVWNLGYIAALAYIGWHRHRGISSE